MKLGIGIPTINRNDLLKESLADIEKNFSSVDNLIIVDNGKQNVTIPVNLQNQSKVIVPDRNLGCAGSWNVLCTNLFLEGMDYALILNDDVVMGKKREDYEYTIGRFEDPYFITSCFYWSIFIISKKCFSEVGPFDAQFFPAYFEDNDYAHRLRKQVPTKVHFGLAELLPVIQRNSMTIKKDQNLNKDFDVNRHRYKLKWGGYPDDEKFPTPYNK